MVPKIYCSKKSLHFHLLLRCPCHDSASPKVVVCHKGIVGPLWIQHINYSDISITLVSPYLWEHPFVKIHENGILLCDLWYGKCKDDPLEVAAKYLSIKNTLHVPMCPQTILDVSSSSRLRPQLHWLKPVHVLPVEEHEPHRADSLVDMEGMPG